MVTTPASFRLMARTGQTFMQLASSHCWHTTGTARVAASYSSTVILDSRGLNC